MTTTLSLETIELAIAELSASIRRDKARNRIAKLFPDEDFVDEIGEVYHARAKYAKHVEFFRLGVEHNERGFMAANRVGKSVVGAYETTVHATGEYPSWWDGYRFDRPVDCWVGSDTSETTRDIVQLALCGPYSDIGTGLIPHRAIKDYAPRRGVPNAIDLMQVRHKSGGLSTLGFKSYDQGREKWQGTARHVIWLDEEPPEDVYDEALIRTMTVNGRMMVTFTPLRGLSAVALRFLPNLVPAPEPEA